MRLKLGDLLGKHPKLAPRRRLAPETSGRKPVLADYVSGKLILRARHKGKTLWAHVRKTGLIWIAGKHFTSPSLAGAHAVERRSCNGWTFWQYQRAAGDWVTLEAMRK